MKRALLFFFILFVSTSIVAQPKEKDNKLSPGLRRFIGQPTKDSADLICSVKNLGFLKSAKIKGHLLELHSSSKTILIRIATSQIQIFLENEVVEFADLLRQPKEELTTGAHDLTLNKLNLAHHLFPDINGSDIRTSIKEQLLDTTDIDLKGRYFNSGVAATTQTSHAAIMATIVAGGANSSPYAIGAATGAAITSSSFASLLPDPDSVYARYKISVQNHSYGTGIENFYGADSKAYDISVFENPSVVHVFSAGNSGNATSTAGLYSGIPEFANITGSFKMAKNSIAVGSTDSFNTVMPLSSRGPAYDGRVKPEMVAFGEDGSSGAAALVSGTAALLEQEYKLKHSNLPSAALVKAVLINSAKDIGAKGPDFISGYGSLDSYNALTTMREDHFFENSVSQGIIKTFSLSIPNNAKQVKITIVWNDTAANANAPKALVNDLDAVLKLPATGETWLPWVLNSYPGKDSLLLPAFRKKDTLNTVEQITIDDPQPGNYLLTVTGTRITTPVQNFSIVYEIDTVNNFIWTYPTGSDVLLSGAVNTIRWETNIGAPGQLEYSLDETAWHSIASVNTSEKFYKWETPDSLSRAVLRLTIPSLNRNSISDTFIISKPLNLRVGFNCPDSFLFFWNKLPSDQYAIYQLGQKYLEPLTQTTDTIKLFQKSGNSSLFYAVAPVVGNKTALRSYTLNYSTQGVACYLRTFYAVLNNNKQAQLYAELGSLYNVASIGFQQLSSTGYQTIHLVNNPSSLVQVFIDSLLTAGTNFYRLEIRFTSGQVVYSPVDKVYYLPGNPVLVFPNPARHNESIKIVTNEPGKYSIQVFDANGRLMKNMMVNDTLQQLPALSLSAGMYFIKIISEDGKIWFQKLIVL